MNNLAARFLPAVSDQKKIEVSLRNDEALIELSTWTEDLGWCKQKTLALDPAMLDDLHRAITAARLKFRRAGYVPEKNSQQSNILEFPRLD